MNLFYTSEISNNIASLSEDDAKHCVKVLRKKTGDVIHIMDGRGGFFKAEITEISKKHCTVKIVESKTEYGKRKVRLHIAIAVPKNPNRLELFIEKACELGIDEITPIYTKNSEKNRIKKERLEKLIISAIKQSKRAYLPQLNEMLSIQDFFSMEHDEKQKLVAWCEEDPARNINEAMKANEDTLVMIGPEGDFDKQEINLAEQNGFSPVSFGKFILRTETAALHVCSYFNALNNYENESEVEKVS